MLFLNNKKKQKKILFTIGNDCYFICDFCHVVGAVDVRIRHSHCSQGGGFENILEVFLFIMRFRQTTYMMLVCCVD